MATPPPVSRLRQDRRIRTLNHWLFLPILLFLFLGANYISWRHYFRADWSLNRFQQISGQTLNLLKNLPGEVVITTFVAPEGDSTGNLIQEDVLKLLEEYKYRAGGKVKLVTVHPYLDFQASQQLVEKFKLSSNENVVILEYGNRSKVLKVAEMAEIDPGMMMVGGAARVKSFLAEEKISSAVSELVQGKTPKVYVSQGHGEFNLQSSDQDPAGYSKLAARLRSQNLELVFWNAGEQEGVPADADAVLVAGSKFPWSASALGALRAYLAKPGRLLLALDPGSPTGLESLLEEQGLGFDANKLFRKVMVLGPSGLGQGTLDEIVGSRFSLHPAIRWIENVGGSLRFAPARSITLKPQSPGATVKTEMLVETSEQCWAKAWPLAAGKKQDFAEGEDRKGPFTLAAVIDGSAPGDKGRESPALRVVAMGSASAFANQNLSPLEVDFMVNGLQWILGRQEALGISPKEPVDFAVALDDRKQWVIRTLLFLALPLGLAGVGALVWWRRRH